MEEDLKRRNEIVKALKKTTEVFCLKEEKTFEELMTNGIWPVADAAGLDRVGIFRFVKTEAGTVPGMIYQWSRSMDGTTPIDEKLAVLSANAFKNDWISVLYDGRYIYKRLCDMPDNERAFLSSFGVKKLFVGPIFNQGEFWGAVILEDNTNEDYVIDGSAEADLLQSAAHLFANAIINEEMIKSIEHRDNLLHAENQAATLLLDSDTESFENALYQSMKIMGEAIKVDRMNIWKNFTVNEQLYCTQIYEWSENAEPQQIKESTPDISYSDNIPRWEKIMSSGECINSMVCNMPPEEQAMLSPQGIVSIMTVPIFIKDLFWGFVCIDDCSNKRTFTENEEITLRSAGRMLAGAFIRNNMTQIMLEYHQIMLEYHQSLQNVLDSLPVAIGIINYDDRKIFYANNSMMEVFGCKDFEKDMAGRSPFDFMHEIQPNGRTAEDLINES
jgi:transcriptional regulator with GAF, ATPase, and Fis domain